LKQLLRGIMSVATDALPILPSTPSAGMTQSPGSTVGAHSMESANVISAFPPGLISHLPSPIQVSSRNVSAASLGGGFTPSSSNGVSASGAAGGIVTPSSATARSRITRIAQTHPLKILLAEDNLINQKMMVMLLRRLGYEIAVAPHGLAALQLLERESRRGPAHEVQCIIMDVSMDVMDGLECTRVIRAEQQPQRLVPFIIAHTANVTAEFKQRCMESGMDCFTVKPVNLDELIRALKLAHADMVRQQLQRDAEKKEQTTRA